MRTTLATFTFAALAAAPALAAPGADEILAANKAATAGPAWDNKAVLKTEYAYSGQGLTGATYNPWADVVTIIGTLDGMREEPPPPAERVIIEDALAQAVAALG